jgi:Zn-finger protein
MYTPIDNKLLAEEAADALVFHATNIADAIKRKDNCFFEHRATSIKVIMDLLRQYTQQETTVTKDLSSEEGAVELTLVK